MGGLKGWERIIDVASDTLTMNCLFLILAKDKRNAHPQRKQLRDN
jgi:hypothetical protein